MLGECLGLYQDSAIAAATLTEVAKDALYMYKLSLSKLREQCYDAISVMQGATCRSGVSRTILKVEPHVPSFAA